MKCYLCGANTSVEYTRESGDGEVVRRRICDANREHRFSTVEVRIEGDRRRLDVSQRVKQGVDLIKQVQTSATWLGALAQLHKEKDK